MSEEYSFGEWIKHSADKMPLYLQEKLIQAERVDGHRFVKLADDINWMKFDVSTGLGIDSYRIATPITEDNITWGDIEPNFKGVIPCEPERLVKVTFGDGFVSILKAEELDDWSAGDGENIVQSYQLEIYDDAEIDCSTEEEEEAFREIEKLQLAKAYSAYFKDVSRLESIDLYRVLELFEVTDHAIGHAIKKLLLCGVRTGGKSAREEIKEARDTLNRRLAMFDEDESNNE